MADGEVGRPSKFTEEIKNKVIYAISKGATFQLACDYSRVSYSTFREWIIRGQAEQEGPYFKFSEDIKEAGGLMAMQCLERIEAAGMREEWTADAWKLERIHAKYYSRDSATVEFNQRLEALEEKKEPIPVEK